MRIFSSLLFCWIASSTSLVAHQSPQAPHITEEIRRTENNEVQHFYFPGLIFYDNEKWIGTDHLLNLGENVSICIELNVEDEKTFPLTNTQLQEIVKKKFESVKIKPYKKEEAFIFESIPSGPQGTSGSPGFALTPEQKAALAKAKGEKNAQGKGPPGTKTLPGAPPGHSNIQKTPQHPSARPTHPFNAPQERGPAVVIKEETPNLPCFHLLVMALPIKTENNEVAGYAVLLAGRLLEQVALRELVLQKNTAWQAITWEAQNLFLTSKNDLKEHVISGIDEILNLFADRYQYYKQFQKLNQ